MSRSIQNTGNKLGLAVLLAMSCVLVTPARAEGDVVQFGHEVHVAKDRSVHDVVCLFCDLNAEGTVKGDIVVIFGDVHIAQRANHDVVNVAGTVTLDDNASVAQDMVDVFGGVNLGEHAHVGQDMVVMFGRLQAASSSSVSGDRVVQPAWIFWVPFLLVASGIVFLVREVRVRRFRQMVLRGY